MTKEEFLKELEKVREGISEEITKLQNDKITREEAYNVIREVSKTLSKLEKELKKINLKG
jgi:DNA repair exonuclease SbcCD ATPase subunit